MSVPLSLCIIVKNEKDYLSKCLASAAGLAEDVVIVDTGSTDGTQEVGRAFGARVIQSTWEDDFSKPKNLAIEEARGRYILWMDADDVMKETDIRAIRALVEDPNRALHAFRFQLTNIRDGKPHGETVNQIRLFPNLPNVRWRRRIHECIAASLLAAGIPIVDSPISITHTGYISDAVCMAKERRNLRIFHKELFPNEVYEDTNCLPDEFVKNRIFLLTMARDLLESGRPYTIAIAQDMLQKYPRPRAQTGIATVAAGSLIRTE